MGLGKTPVMIPYADSTSGRFKALYALILNGKGELLIELTLEGSMALPGGVVSEEEAREFERDSTSIIRSKLLRDFGIEATEMVL